MTLPAHTPALRLEGKRPSPYATTDFKRDSRETGMMRFAAALCCALFLVSGAAVARPFLNDGKKFRIVEVRIETHQRYRGTANFAEEVRYRTQNAAYKMSEEGEEKILRILLRILTVADSGRALTTSGSSSIRATATLIDKATGIPDKRFKARGRIFRLGGVIGALAIAADGVDHVTDEKRLAELLAKRLMTTIYGEEHWESAQDRQPAKTAAPDYPMSWEEAYKQYDCQTQQADAAKGGRWAADGEEVSPEDAARRLAELKARCGNYLTEDEADDAKGIQIVEIQVEPHSRFKATANLPEEVRYLTQNAAYRFSETGREKKLRLLLRTLVIPAPGKTGDDSSMRITATLIDKATGRVGRRYKAKARITREGGDGGSAIDRVEDEKQLARLAAEQIMMRIYGKDHAAQVKDRQPSRTAAPQHPMTWEDAGRQYRPAK